jgi:DNA helicase-2/ATP-dependent DNA helicase PcrA
VALREDEVGTAAERAGGGARPVWLDGLNPEQRSAVEHDGGPLMVLAGAGTGKTKTLVCRLARLIATGTPPERILLVTFSRRAADEMVRRVGALTDPAVAAQVQAGTFHAMAQRILQRSGAGIGLSEGFTVLDQGDASELMGLVRAGVVTAERERAEIAGAPDGGRARFPRAETLLAVYSRVVNAQLSLDTVLRESFPWCVADADAIRLVFTAYADRKRRGHLLDFDDLLLYWRAAATDPTLGPVLARHYDHVLVDEYQDTNVLQADILRGLRRADGRLTVVGDDAQAIYSFRAATVRNLLDFGSDFPGATTVALEHNYRSSQPILDLANAVVADMTSGFAKSLWTDRPGGARPELATCPDEAAQTGAVCEVVLDHLERGLALRDQAVLFRSGHHSDHLEVELRRRRIPYVKSGGLRFVEAAHVRDLVALLRVLDNPWDELAWHRILLLLDGVGPVTTRRVLADLGIRTSPDGADPAGPSGDAPGDSDDGGGAVVLPRSPDDPLARFLGPDRPRLPRAEPALGGLVDALTACATGTLSPGVELGRLRLALDPLIRARYDHAEVRLRNLDQLAHLAAASPSRARLVADLTLDPPASTGDFAGPPHLDDDYLTLSTVHSAKGGEWRAVHLIHAADGMFPSDMATGTPDGIDEERRLFYVALTRAKEHLHIYAPLRYHHERSHGRGDRHSYAPRTRFLPPAVDPLLDHRPVRTALDRGPSLTGVDLPDAVHTALRALW